jgi:formylmethanofuran dehydrogenase subunit C
MSAVVRLVLRTPVTERLEVDGVAADRFAELDERSIAALPVWIDRREARVGDFFDVQGGRSDRVRVEGATARVCGLGAGMRGGELVIDGDAGDGVAAHMTGGSVTVTGRAGDEAGLAMSGGTLHIHGAAGDRVGGVPPGAARGMTGGEIVVGRGAGDDVAARARRGLVVIGGGVGHAAARAMIAGTLVVFGGALGEAGRGSKRGSVVAVGAVPVPSTYRYACTYEPPWIRLLMSYLTRRYGLAIDARVRDGRYQRYCGDLIAPGKGEILLLSEA